MSIGTEAGQTRACTNPTTAHISFSFACCLGPVETCLPHMIRGCLILPLIHCIFSNTNSQSHTWCRKVGTPPPPLRIYSNIYSKHWISLSVLPWLIFPLISYDEITQHEEKNTMLFFHNLLILIKINWANVLQLKRLKPESRSKERNIRQA